MVWEIPLFWEIKLSRVKVQAWSTKLIWISCKAQTHPIRSSSRIWAMAKNLVFCSWSRTQAAIWWLAQSWSLLTQTLSNWCKVKSTCNLRPIFCNRRSTKTGKTLDQGPIQVATNCQLSCWWDLWSTMLNQVHIICNETWKSWLMWA